MAKQESSDKRDSRIDLNTVTMNGHLTKDPTTRELKSKDPERGPTAYTEMRIACSNGKRPNGDVNPPTFVDVATYGRLAEVCAENLSKGSQISVQGRLELQEWESADQETGEIRRHSRMVINTARAGQVQFLRSPQAPDITPEADMPALEPV